MTVTNIHNVMSDLSRFRIIAYLIATDRRKLVASQTEAPFERTAA
ncbi:MAG: hypothetical protein ABR530_01945 [Pyrinomonadaceae bacterium]